MKNLFHKYKYHLGILLLVSAIFVANYKSGIYLTGWDNLQTDLNPWLGVKRAFFSVWQEYQSFGLVSGMAHASDLIRTFFIWILSFILPQNLIRYFYHHFMLLVGGIGMLGLLGSFGILGIIGFLGSAFYLLNFGTVQYFYFPYEAFSHFWAFFPWLIWAWIRQKKKKTLSFFLINLLATPAFYVQTLFLVYILTLLCFTIGEFWKIRVIEVIKKAFFGFILIFLINSFWILPQFYFLKNSLNNPTQAKINQLSNQVTLNQNKAFGNISDFLALKGFYYDLTDQNQIAFFQPWKNHFNSYPFVIIQTIIVGFIVFGFIYSLFRSKHNFFLILLLIMNAIFLLSNTVGFNYINSLFYQYPLLDQLFRNPFTKYIVPHIFLMTIFFTYGLSGIKNLNLQKSKVFIFYLLLFILIIFSSLPTFQGNFISEKMKVIIPQDYFNLMNYFNNEDKNKRIALLPDYTHWGWFFNKWGYNGSGFLWYGIEQPIVSRTFDVWSDKSESYFWEIKTAIINENPDLFNSVLKKYNIDYLILDKSLLPNSTSYKALRYETLSKLLNNNSNFHKIMSSENIDLFKIINSGGSSKNFISIKNNLPNIGPNIKLTNEDSAFINHGNYITDSSQNYREYYPFLNLQSYNALKNNDWNISDNGQIITLSTDLPNNILTSSYKLNIPENPAGFQFYYENELINISLEPKIQIKNSKLNVQFPLNSILTKDFKLQTSNACPEQKNKVCFGYHFNYLPQNYGYIIKIKTENVSGDRLLFYINDSTNDQAIIEDRPVNGLNYYVLPPILKHGLGYSLNFNNTSYKNITSENKLFDLEIYPLPYNYLKELKIIRNDYSNGYIEQTSTDYSSNKINYFLYSVDLENVAENSVLTLDQSFSNGWKTYQIQSSKFKVQNLLNTYFPFVFGKEIKEHILVNNWANGWKISQELVKNGQSSSKLVNVNQELVKDSQTDQSSLKIVIVFWPQYLEFIGFALLIFSFLVILKVNPNKAKLV